MFMFKGYKLKISPLSVEARLPSHYKKFREELKKPPAPVHYIPVSEKWKIDPVTGERKREENVALPLIFPKEADEGIWGGEAVIKGFTKFKRTVRRRPNFWMPTIKRSVVYSEILNKYFSIHVTERTLQLIDKHYGFDNYILETPVQDLKSQLAFDLRRHMLLALVNKEKVYDDPNQQEKIYEKYKKFIIPKEEAEWFGLSLREAIKKQKLIEYSIKPIPLKIQYRKAFIESLKEIKAKEAEEKEVKSSSSSWLSKLNLFRQEKEGNPQ